MYIDHLNSGYNSLNHYSNNDLALSNKVYLLTQITDKDAHYITKNDKYKYRVVRASFPNGGYEDDIIELKVLKLSFQNQYCKTYSNAYYSDSVFFASMTIRIIWIVNSTSFSVQCLVKNYGSGISAAPYYDIAYLE